MYIHTHVCLYSLLLCYVFICMLLHVQANTCSKVSYKILSWRGKIGWQQDDSSVRNACVPTRGVWGHASQENLHPLRLLLMESRTKTVAGGRKIPAPPLVWNPVYCVYKYPFLLYIFSEWCEDVTVWSVGEQHVQSHQPLTHCIEPNYQFTHSLPHADS